MSVAKSPSFYSDQQQFQAACLFARLNCSLCFVCSPWVSSLGWPRLSLVRLVPEGLFRDS